MHTQGPSQPEPRREGEGLPRSSQEGLIRLPRLSWPWLEPGAGGESGAHTHAQVAPPVPSWSEAF